MLAQKVIEELGSRLAEVLATAPARDMEKNLKAALTGLLGRLDLVTRDEFDAQTQILVRTREELATLEARLSKLDGIPVARPMPLEAASAATEFTGNGNPDNT